MVLLIPTWTFKMINKIIIKLKHRYFKFYSCEIWFVTINIFEYCREEVNHRVSLKFSLNSLIYELLLTLNLSFSCWSSSFYILSLATLCLHLVLVPKFSGSHFTLVGEMLNWDWRKILLLVSSSRRLAPLLLPRASNAVTVCSTTIVSTFMVQDRSVSLSNVSPLNFKVSTTRFSCGQLARYANRRLHGYQCQTTPGSILSASIWSSVFGVHHWNHEQVYAHMIYTKTLSDVSPSKGSLFASSGTILICMTS